MTQDGGGLDQGWSPASIPTSKNRHLGVIIVHPNRILREALAVVLGRCTSVRVIGCLPDVVHLTAVSVGRFCAPDVVLLGGGLGSGHIDKQVASLRTLFLNAKVILLKDDAPPLHGESPLPTETLQATTVGSNCSLREFVKTFRFPPTPRQFQPIHYAEGQTIPLLQASKRQGTSLQSGLTAREAEVFRLRQQGLSHKAIAVTLHLEVQTVKNHARTLALKLRLQHHSGQLRPGQMDPKAAFSVAPLDTTEQTKKV